MHRRFVLWFTGLFLAAATLAVGCAVLAPDLFGGQGNTGWLSLSLAIVALCIITIDAVLRIRARSSVITSILPLALFALIAGVTFQEEIVTLSEFLGGRGSAGIRCEPDEDGRYRPLLMIAGQPVSFVLDTSVDDVVLGVDDAERAGIDVASLAFDDETLVGDARLPAAAIELDDVQFGSFAISGLQAKVSASALGGNVLGMEFLDRFSRWRIEDGALILEP